MIRQDVEPANLGLTYDGKNSGNYVVNYLQKYCDSDDKQFVISMKAVAQQ